MSNETAVSSSARPADAGSQADPRRWRQLALLGGLLSVDNSEASVIPVMFPAIRKALDVKLAGLGALTAVSKLVGAFAGPMWVSVARRRPRKQVLVLCCGMWGVFTIAAGLVQNYIQLIALVAVISFGLAGGGPLTNGLIADLFDDRTRGRAAGGLYGIAFIGVGIAGPVFGALSHAHNGWRYGFFISGLIQITFGLATLLFLRDPGVGAAEGTATARETTVAARQGERARVKVLLGNRTLRLMCFQRLVTGQFVLLTFGTTFMVDDRGYSNAKASLITVPVGVAYVIGTFLGGVLGDRAHRRRPRSGRIMVLQTAMFVYAPIAYVLTQIHWKQFGIYLLLFALMAATQSVVPGVNRPIVMSVVAPEMRSTAFGMLLSAEAIGWALTNLLTGIVGDAYSLQTAFLWFSVILMLANGALFFGLYRPYAQDAAALEATLHAPEAIQ
ncbi:MFS transporter [Catenulispora pinisilvae]|uniref:MFS transporter n=1 Tax=Catenulispora pinisilvae TaxID=2705253 RepID=UPI00189121F7|nr:MFS transporter [Catenulispora pinisilvae]